MPRHRPAPANDVKADGQLAAIEQRIASVLDEREVYRIAERAATRRNSNLRRTLESDLTIRAGSDVTAAALQSHKHIVEHDGVRAKDIREAQSNRLAPQAWFDNQAEEAASFYVSLFSNSKTGIKTCYNEDIAKVAERPTGSVMTVDFQLEGQDFIALNGNDEFDIHCFKQAPTGSNIPLRRCAPNFVVQAEAQASENTVLGRGRADTRITRDYAILFEQKSKALTEEMQRLAREDPQLMRDLVRLDELKRQQANGKPARRPAG